MQPAGGTLRGATYGHFSGVEFFLVPGRVYARPLAGIPLRKNTFGDDVANGWAPSLKP